MLQKMKEENQNKNNLDEGIIKSILPEIPSTAGVYKFFNKQKQIIYIGKAKDLKKRLASYARVDYSYDKNDLITIKTIKLIEAAKSVEYITTNSETEALILEANLIKEFKPKFNILLKDDKSFPYLTLLEEHKYPRFIKSRAKELTTVSSPNIFGPFLSSSKVDLTLRELQNLFRLRSCSDEYFASRIRPCLQYEIGRCSAPCVGKIDQKEYKNNIEEAKKFLRGQNISLQKALAARMEYFSQTLEYEKAAKIRDKIKAVNQVINNNSIIDEKNAVIKTDSDFIAITENNGIFCLYILSYRKGMLCGGKSYFPANTELQNITEVMEAFLCQFYQSFPVAKQIFINQSIENQTQIEEMLYKFSGNDKIKSKIHILPINSLEAHKSSSSKKQIIMQNAYENAENTLNGEIKKIFYNQQMMKEIAEVFCLKNSPNRIEVYDNSHIMGSFAVGAMIVATKKEGLNKKEYRLFNIENTKIPDDYAMLREVMNRRFAKIKTQQDKIPDLIIIDGGLSHLTVAHNVMQKYDLNLNLVAMSKGEKRNNGNEQFHMINKPSFTLDNSSKLMKYLQIMRDEAHNFAITNHRKKRAKAIRASSLDKIEGIGKKRKIQLLNHFGSYEEIKKASLEQLTNLPGFNKKIAGKILSSS